MKKPINFSGLTQFAGKHTSIILHIAIWLILFIFPAWFLYVDSSRDHVFLFRTFTQIFLYAVIFYANYLLFTPKFFLVRKKLLYFVVALSLVAIATLVNDRVFHAVDNHNHEGQNELGMHPRFQPPPGIPYMPKDLFPTEHKRPSDNWPMYNFIITTLFLSGFGMGLGFSDKLRQHEREKKEAEKEKLNTELAFLKNQINPHFLFNTLNNIYSLVQSNVADGQKAILQLSKLMRYILYETDADHKLLSQEIDFMKMYIELMKLRISEKISLTVNFPENYPNISLPPLLFLPFVENAFKHGISYRRPSFVRVLLKVESEKIIFECSNSIVKNGEDMFRADSGIGLGNVKKRLALLYPDKHDLKIIDDGSTYNILLVIDLPKNLAG